MSDPRNIQICHCKLLNILQIVTKVSGEWRWNYIFRRISKHFNDALHFAFDMQRKKLNKFSSNSIRLNRNSRLIHDSVQWNLISQQRRRNMLQYRKFFRECLIENFYVKSNCVLLVSAYVFCRRHIFNSLFFSSNILYACVFM